MSGKTESWLTPGQTAAILGVSPKTLANHRYRGDWPLRWRKLGPAQPNRKNDSRLVRYLAADVARFQKLNEPQFGTEAV